MPVRARLNSTRSAVVISSSADAEPSATTMQMVIVQRERQAPTRPVLAAASSR